MSSRKGQAAMEFIMTYGWAILVVLIVIGALVYFGVLSPERFLPERCSFPAELSCIGKPLADFNADTITLSLVNNVGYPITLTQEISTETGSSCLSPMVQTIGGNPPNVSMLNGEQMLLVINCTSFDEGRFKADVTLHYLHTQNGIEYPVTGEVRATAR